MTKFSTLRSGVAAFTLLAVGAIRAAAAPADAYDGTWHFSFEPYVWVPAFTGNFDFDAPPGVNGRPSVHASAGDLLSALKFAIMGTGDARNLAMQRADTMRQWAEPFVKLRVPYIMNLRRDPFERAEYNSNTYLDWMVDHVPQMYEMQAVVAQQIADFVKFPPRQKPASFNLDDVLAQITSHGHG